MDVVAEAGEMGAGVSNEVGGRFIAKELVAREGERESLDIPGICSPSPLLSLYV